MGKSKLMSFVRVNSVQLPVEVDASGMLLLPDDSEVSDSLLLTGRIDLTALPTNLHGTGNLCLDNTGVTVLPDGLRTGLFLSICDTAIEELPEDLVVGGDLYVRGSKVRQTPRTVRIGGDVAGLGEKGFAS